MVVSGARRLILTELARTHDGHCCSQPPAEVLSPHPWGRGCPSSLLLLAASHQTLCTHPRVPQGRLRSSERPPEDLPGRRRFPAHPQESVWPAPCCKKDFFLLLWGFAAAVCASSREQGPLGGRARPAAWPQISLPCPLLRFALSKASVPSGAVCQGCPFSSRFLG